MTKISALTINTINEKLAPHKIRVNLCEPKGDSLNQPTYTVEKFESVKPSDGFKELLNNFKKEAIQELYHTHSRSNLDAYLLKNHASQLGLTSPTMKAKKIPSKKLGVNM